MANASVNFPKKPDEKPLDCSTRDAIADGLIDLLKPSVEEIDGRVKTVRYKLVYIDLSYEEVGVIIIYFFFFLTVYGETHSFEYNMFLLSKSLP
jgi:hypothetical protein